MRRSSLGPCAATPTPPPFRPAAVELEKGARPLILSCLPFHHSLSLISPPKLCSIPKPLDCTQRRALLHPQRRRLNPSLDSYLDDRVKMPNKARAAQGSKDVAAPLSARGAQGRLRQLSSLAGFWTLPQELRQLILFTACGLPVLPRHIIVGRSFDCTTTMISLLRTAKTFYATIIPMLYAHVRLSRPSTLRAFQRTLSDRPSLGQLVRSLHIGADEPLPETWWPAREAGCGDPDHKVFWLNLGVIDGKGPAWKDSDSYEHELDDYDEEDAEADALDDAFEAAAHDLQVNVRVRNRDGMGGDIGSDEWHVRVLELQAAIEIYYLEMQRCDNRARAKKEKELKRKIEKKKSSASRISIRPRYPPLRVARSGSSPSGNFGKGDFAIKRSQILERMTSAGAPTDSFIHPVLFARSALSWSAVDYDDKVHSGNNDREWNSVEETVDAFSTSYFSSTSAVPGTTVSAASTTGAKIDLISNARLATATVSGILALARCVLSLTPRVRSLSLTGFFEHILVGERASCHQSLHTVSIGPPPVGWEVPLHFSNTALNTVKRLRVCGCMLEKKEAASICGDDGALPQLKKFVWSIRGKGDEGEVSE